MLIIAVLINSCNRQKQPLIIIIPKDCGFYRIVESKLLSGNQTLQGKKQLGFIKKNNIDACERCPQFQNLIKCKQTLKERDLIRDNLSRLHQNK